MQQGLRLWRAEVAGLARKIEVARDRLPAWPSDKLMVLSESPSAFYDLMPPQLVEQVCRELGSAGQADSGGYFFICAQPLSKTAQSSSAME